MHSRGERSKLRQVAEYPSIYLLDFRRSGWQVQSGAAAPAQAEHRRCRASRASARKELSALIADAERAS